MYKAYCGVYSILEKALHIVVMATAHVRVGLHMMDVPFIFHLNVAQEKKCILPIITLHVLLQCLSQYLYKQLLWS